jgi:hypothetical protein
MCVLSARYCAQILYRAIDFSAFSPACHAGGRWFAVHYKSISSLEGELMRLKRIAVIISHAIRYLVTPHKPQACSYGGHHRPTPSRIDFLLR